MEQEHATASQQASTGAIIDTLAQRIVAALFERPNDAVNAKADLEREGFPSEAIRVFTSAQADPPVASHDTDHIVPALTAMGIPEDVASYYKVDVRNGMTLMTVLANERAQDVLNLIHSVNRSEARALS